MRERPDAQFLLADLPQPGQSVRLDSEEENDNKVWEGGKGGITRSRVKERGGEEG